MTNFTLSSDFSLQRQRLLQNVGASNVDQVQEDVHELPWDILLNSKHREEEAEWGQNIYTSVGLAHSFQHEEDNSSKQYHKAQEAKQEKAAGSKQQHLLSLPFGNTALGEHVASSPSGKCRRISSGIWKRARCFKTAHALLAFRSHLVAKYGNLRHQCMRITLPQGDGIGQEVFLRAQSFYIQCSVWTTSKQKTKPVKGWAHR